MTVSAAIQWTNIMKYQLPIPIALAILSTVAPFLNFFAHPSELLYYDKYIGDADDAAVRIFNVSTSRRR
jgi:hypothetical protein